MKWQPTVELAHSVLMRKYTFRPPHSLVSGSSSVRVITSAVRTSGVWGLSLSWSTLQSGDWQDSLWDVQLLSKEVYTLVSQGVVVVLPRELSLDETLRGQGLQSLDHVQVLGVNLLMLWLVEVLLSNNNTLCLLVFTLEKTTTPKPFIFKVGELKLKYTLGV